MIQLLHAPSDVRAHCDALRAKGARVGLVPTMGALHAGHLSLVRALRERGAGPIVVSIFVNPLQFGANEDFDRYPRTLEADVTMLQGMNVDAVFAPSPADMYPRGFQTHVAVEQVTGPLEGERRPTHFQGVTTVVNKLFNAVGPCVAAFGRKDYQQWRVIDTMVRDLNMPIQVVGCPIVREADGLALSSRNRYLAAPERKRATAIFRGLLTAQTLFEGGQRDALSLVSAARGPIAEAFDDIDYVALCDPDDLSPVEGQAGARAALLVAARLGNTRLIDNTVLGEDDLSPADP